MPLRKRWGREGPVERSAGRSDRGRCRCTMREAKGFICRPILVYRPGHAIPTFWVGVQRPAGYHSGYGILNLGVKSPAELDNGGFWVSVTGVG